MGNGKGEKRTYPPASSGTKGPDVQQELGQFTGTIKSFNQKNGYGFITCPDLNSQGFQDVFLHHAQLNGFEVGSTVQFTAFINKKGSVQAMDLEEFGSEEPEQ